MQSKNMARALRRHHTRRLKAKRRVYWGHHRGGAYALEWTARQLGMVVATPHPCSCLGCGNERRWTGERTVQERRFFQFDPEQLLDGDDGSDTAE